MIERQTIEQFETISVIIEITLFQTAYIMIVILDIEMTYTYPRRHWPCIRREFIIRA